MISSSLLKQEVRRKIRETKKNSERNTEESAQSTPREKMPEPHPYRKKRKGRGGKRRAHI